MNIKKRWRMHKSIDRFVVGVIIEICFSRFSLRCWCLFHSSPVMLKKKEKIEHQEKVSHKNWFLHFVMVLRISSNNCYSIYGTSGRAKSVQSSFKFFSTVWCKGKLRQHKPRIWNRYGNLDTTHSDEICLLSFNCKFKFIEKGRDTKGKRDLMEPIEEKPKDLLIPDLIPRKSQAA